MARNWIRPFAGAIIPNVAATTMRNIGVRRLGPNKASAFIDLMPVLGSVASMMIIREPVNSHHFFGIVLTCFGMVLALRFKPKKSVSVPVRVEKNLNSL